ncbi:ATP-dependent metallopeptidase FtsH/Yme1/Tma family protein [Anaerotignum lactatifermentans]|uniref:ATP-dependent zinc metalloprotease FtsH n=1 Tax=Anaerotignum lactatifermentans TaxID=160404 RepID=A0ABS2GB97_9FIRM|nr:ATP-dependent zinc metalloprotease FtsH [Anaerotignum lactatifermentans]MBM6830222.1 ATP-dependent metallopeptidase FtsH/Yme1/Tma family protein [Anaerotignum lactatifermentans]MBM6878771.1 ATP-dependent metallopeptidase FtsH/Yme1/Tma family protein [Anaerotignum lactatifermentans]MBM6951835.1 ATP-dependent metallopeptidase FtsH/Yme1/Tma family protein [Anaerotignum lactatifermentans]
MNQERKPLIYYWIIALAIMAAINLFLLPFLSSSNIQQVSYNVFLDQLEEKNISEVQVNEDVIYYSLKTDDNTTFTGQPRLYTTVRMQDSMLVDRLYEAGANFSAIEPKEVSPWVSSLVMFLLFFLAWRLIFGRMVKKGGFGGNAMSFGKANAKIYVKAQTGKTFRDVAGQDEAKEALSEIVDFLHNPGKYTAVGAKMPKGALLVGPPGTGKTLLAQAVAGEANVPFFSISGSEFVEMFVGMGAAKVRDLFKQAGEKAPCIVFIDEIDTIGKKRDGGGVSGNDEREQTLNQLLTEMDGFDSTKGVVILAATNRPESLDKALLRPGRFDRRIPVELPDLQGREAILKVHAEKIQMEPDVDFSAIARATSGASGAELANIINEGALRAVRMGRTRVSQNDLEESVEVILAGYQRKGAVISKKEKAIIAYHEVGHALVAALQKNSAPVHKITIIPRTSGALGYTLQVDEGEKFLMSKEEAFNRIATFTGGRVAEEIKFHSITTGASNDIEQATRMARAMITRYGMSEEFGMVALETVNNQYLGGDTSLACSNDTANKIDEAVIQMVKAAHDKAYEIIDSHRDKLDEISAYLLEKETITGEEFMEILQREPVTA